MQWVCVPSASTHWRFILHAMNSGFRVRPPPPIEIDDPLPPPVSSCGGVHHDSSPSQIVKQHALLSRYNDLYSRARNDAMASLRLCSDDNDRNQRIVTQAVIVSSLLDKRFDNDEGILFLINVLTFFFVSFILMGQNFTLTDWSCVQTMNFITVRLTCTLMRENLIEFSAVPSENVP